jgi:hypothetical protein
MEHIDWTFDLLNLNHAKITMLVQPYNTPNEANPTIWHQKVIFDSCFLIEKSLIQFGWSNMFTKIIKFCSICNCDRTLPTIPLTFYLFFDVNIIWFAQTQINVMSIIYI